MIISQKEQNQFRVLLSDAHAKIKLEKMDELVEKLDAIGKKIEDAQVVTVEDVERTRVQ